MNAKRLWTRTLALAALAVTALGAASACNDTLDPIFYTIEREEPLRDAGLPNEASVDALVAAGAYYLAALGALYYRPTSYLADWARLPFRGAPSSAICRALAADATTLYAGLRTSGGSTGIGVWTTGRVGFDPDTSTWTQTGVPAALQDVLVLWIKEAGNGEVFVNTRSGRIQTLFAASNGVAVVTAANDVVINDITWNPVAGLYYAVAGNEIWSGANTAAAFGNGGTPAVAGISSINYFGGIYYAAGPARMYASTGNGYLLSTGDPISWIASAQLEAEETGSPVAFTRFLQVGADVLVGTRLSGYFRLTGGALNSPAPSREPDFNVSDLYGGAVHSFFEDGSRLFALTHGAGLWSSTDQGASWRTRE